MGIPQAARMLPAIAWANTLNPKPFVPLVATEGRASKSSPGSLRDGVDTEEAVAAAAAGGDGGSAAMSSCLRWRRFLSGSTFGLRIKGVARMVLSIGFEGLGLG